MNKQEFSAIMLIVKKLGWNDMPAAITIEAIKKMVVNDISLGQDCCGITETIEDTLLTVATWDADKIWMTLFISDYQTLHDESLNHWALAYRKEIESHMREGMSFENACLDWNIPSKEWEWEQYQNYLNDMQAEYDETIVSLKYSCY